MSLSVGGYPQTYPHHHAHHPQPPHHYPHHHHPSHHLQNGGMPSPAPHDFYNSYAHQIPRYAEHPHQHETPGHAAAAVAAGGYFPNWMLTPPAEISTVSGHIPDGYHSFGPPASNSPGGTHYQSFIQYENGVPIRCIKRRVTANKKERRRTLSINNAFSQLRGCIPNVPSDTKLSKIKTLRLATSYISYLMDILAKDEPDNMSRTGFKADLTKKPTCSSSSILSSQGSGMECSLNGIKADPCSVVSGIVAHGRNACHDRGDDKRKRESDGESEASSHGSSPCPEKKTKGRTGWPQHVWAAELK